MFSTTVKMGVIDKPEMCEIEPLNNVETEKT
jgi:hypothetical protein